MSPPTIDTSAAAAKVAKRVSIAESTAPAKGDLKTSSRPSVVATPRGDDGDQWGHGQRLEYWTATIFNHVRANRKGDVALALGEVCALQALRRH